MDAADVTCVVVTLPCYQTERDVSVRQRAVDLLYAMCDRSNAQQIVAEMLSYLETADYSIREEIVSTMPGTACNAVCLVPAILCLRWLVHMLRVCCNAHTSIGNSVVPVFECGRLWWLLAGRHTGIPGPFPVAHLCSGHEPSLVPAAGPVFLVSLTRRGSVELVLWS